jgi:iron complex transport system substrate-binding protein
MQDHLGRRVELPDVAQRIVSLCPSITETLFHLGVGERVVGRTRFCVRPAQAVRQAQVVGGTKQVDVERVRSLRPDLVIAQKEENTREVVDALAVFAPVFVGDVETMDDGLRLIDDLGVITGSVSAATQLVRAVREAFADLPQADAVRVAWLIWRNPWMAAGAHTYITDLLQRAGFVNVCARMDDARYPEITLAQLRERKTQVVLLSSEPYPFAESHARELSEQLPGMRVLCADGELSWYGVGMVRAARELTRLVRAVRALPS